MFPCRTARDMAVSYSMPAVLVEHYLVVEFRTEQEVTGVHCCAK